MSQKKKEDKTEDKRADKRKDFKRKEDERYYKKRGMLATWSDSDSTSQLENDNANLCLMAREDFTKDSKTPIAVTIDNLINVPTEVLKDRVKPV